MSWYEDIGLNRDKYDTKKWSAIDLYPDRSTFCFCIGVAIFFYII